MPIISEPRFSDNLRFFNAYQNRGQLASFNGYAINLRFYTINMIIRTLTQMPKRVIGS
ncbi:hypothetical protein D3OALGB2SA_2250, partial [Olavius algarvensis associated proteobacterium Delta 3]